MLTHFVDNRMEKVGRRLRKKSKMSDDAESREWRRTENGYGTEVIGDTTGKETCQSREKYMLMLLLMFLLVFICISRFFFKKTTLQGCLTIMLQR